MKRFWLAVILLLILFFFCTGSMLYTADCVSVMDSLLADAEETASRAHFAEAETKISEAVQIWDSRAAALGALLRHDEADCVATDLAALQQYAGCSDVDDFLAGCAALRKRLMHIREMEQPLLRNIL